MNLILYKFENGHKFYDKATGLEIINATDYEVTGIVTCGNQAAFDGCIPFEYNTPFPLPSNLKLEDAEYSPCMKAKTCLDYEKNISEKPDDAGGCLLRRASNHQCNRLKKCLRLVKVESEESHPYFKLSTNEHGKHWLFYKPLKDQPGKYGCWMPIDDEFYAEFKKLSAQKEIEALKAERDVLQIQIGLLLSENSELRSQVNEPLFDKMRHERDHFKSLCELGEKVIESYRAEPVRDGYNEWLKSHTPIVQAFDELKKKQI